MSNSQHFPGITLDNFIYQLRQARKEVGGDAKVCVCVPYGNGPGWRYEYAINAHAYGGNVGVPITLNYSAEVRK